MSPIFSVVLCLAMMLTLVSCGGKPAVPAIPDQQSPPAASSVEEEDTPDPEEGESSIQPEFQPELTFREVDASAFAEDNTLLLDCTYVEPMLLLPNREIQSIIQDDLNDVVESLLHTREEYVEMSQTEYNERDEEGCYALMDENGSYVPYYLKLEGRVERMDETIISVVFAQYMYTHGAHGGTSSFTCNYDAKTGERLTFDALGESFRDTAEALVLAKADEIAAQAIAGGEDAPFYPNYAENIGLVVLDGTETDVDIWGTELAEGEEPAYMSPSYYFTDKGIVFISDEYVLQPYAAGIVEFEIPYADFGDALYAELIPEA